MEGDDGHKHAHTLTDVAYFPNAPVNLLSLTCFAQQLNDEEGTRINTGLIHSIFTWDNGQYKRTLHHPITRLAELPINERFSDVCNLHRKLARSHDSKSTATMSSTRNAFFAIGEAVYARTETGTTVTGKISDVHPDPETLVTKYTITTRNEEQIIRPPEDILPTQEPSIHCGLSPLQHELYMWHLRLGHATWDNLMRHANKGRIPKRLRQTPKFLLCPSCLLGQAHR